MSSVNDFIIEDGVLTKYVGQGGDIVIPDGVIKIGSWGLSKCRNLTSITIPDSMTSIGEFAFYGCNKLVNIFVSEQNSVYRSIDGNLYTKDGKTFVLYAKGKCDNYFSVPNHVTMIDREAFLTCDNLESIILPNSIISIGYYAFNASLRLRSILYRGTKEESSNILIEDYGYDPTINPANWYFYSEDTPTEERKFWHFMKDVPVLW
jgi:hypothetical protein